MSTSLKDRPDDFNIPPELRRLIEQIRQHGSDSMDEIQRGLVVQIFRTAAMTGDKRISVIRNKIQEAHLEYCFRLPAIRRK
jgi:hypothetical protein